ncbi:unnamed protein product [Lactuca virosa]|uniref:Uncharacterized protein n=1 Tax=Lactuca virosa TaxID=75947 RepID=A0AAU9LIF1_9ASTR|nr:unnamed protein product [Lactuca virosa]
MPAHVFSSSAMDSLPSAPRLVFLLNAPPFLRLHIPTFESGFSVCFHRFFHSISSTHIHGDQVVATEECRIRRVHLLQHPSPTLILASRVHCHHLFQLMLHYGSPIQCLHWWYGNNSNYHMRCFFDFLSAYKKSMEFLLLFEDMDLCCETISTYGW